MASRAKSPMPGKANRRSGLFEREVQTESSKASGVRSLLHRIKRKRSKSELIVMNESQGETPRVVVTFVNALTAEKLSNLVVWFLYYDVYQLPESPSRWYSHIDTMDMRGWIALGDFLSGGVSYGLDLVVLDSICDRLQLEKRLLHDCLIQLADPNQMRWTTVATTLHTAGQEHKSTLGALELVKHKLLKLRTLANNLTPTPESEFAEWHPKVFERLSGFLHAIVEPQVLSLRGGTCGAIDIVSEREERELLFLYETIQQERQVPLVRYGIFPDSHLTPSDLANLEGPALSDELLCDDCELERSFSAASLRRQNRQLRVKVLQLEKDKRNLEESNIKLASKVSKMSRGQPREYVQPMTPVVAGHDSKQPHSFIKDARPQYRNNTAAQPEARHTPKRAVQTGLLRPPQPVGQSQTDRLSSLRSWHSGSMDANSEIAPDSARQQGAVHSAITEHTHDPEADPSDLSDLAYVFAGFDSQPQAAPAATPINKARNLTSNPPSFPAPEPDLNAKHFLPPPSTPVRDSAYESTTSSVQTMPRAQSMQSTNAPIPYHPVPQQVRSMLDIGPIEDWDLVQSGVPSRPQTARSSRCNSLTALPEPSARNSIAEYQARQVNVSEVQQPIEPYRKRKGSISPTSDHSSSEAVVPRSRRPSVAEASVLRKDKRRSWSMNSRTVRPEVDGVTGVEINPATNF